MKKITKEMLSCEDILRKLSTDLDELVETGSLDSYILVCATTNYDSKEGWHNDSATTTVGDTEDLLVEIAHIIKNLSDKQHIAISVLVTAIIDILKDIKSGNGYEVARN